MKPISDAPPRVDSTDANLAKNVRLLLDANRSGFRRINVWAEAGTVRLSGRVISFFLRQMAVVIAKRAAGVRNVVDDLEVGPGPMNSCHEVEP